MQPGVLALALLGAAVLVGAGTQRITGLGFALVSGPFLVLLLGPFTGVLLANTLSIATSAIVLGQTWRSVDVRKAVLLALPAMVAVVPGAWLVRALPAPVLALTAGGLVLVALVAVLATERARVLRGTTGAVVAGAASGFMNVTAGVGGPAMGLYALSTAWTGRAFVATLQLYFLLLNGASVVAKGWPALTPVTWAVAVGSLAVGAVAGHHLARRVPAERARLLVAGLAILGSAAIVAEALVDLLGPG